MRSLLEEDPTEMLGLEEENDPMDLIGSEEDEDEDPRELMSLGDDDEEDEEPIESASYDEEEDPMELMGLEEEDEEEEEGEEGPETVRQRVPGLLRTAQGLPQTPGSTDVYDDDLVRLVQEFQRQHRLNVDGGGPPGRSVLFCASRRSDNSVPVSPMPAIEVVVMNNRRDT